jgi:uncharacterized protein YdhG (YjbR/CyaY superfamily)
MGQRAGQPCCPVRFVESEEGARVRLASVRILLRVSAVDDYLSGLDVATRAAFEHIRNLVMDLVPEAEQGVSYGMATLKYQQKPLLAFLAAKHHLSIFPFSPKVVDSVREQLAGFELSKGTIRFTLAKPLPDEIVRDLVRRRMDEIVGAGR